MPFIPHSDDDVRQMLATIGADDIEALFDEIPASLKVRSLEKVPEGLSEMDVSRLMRERARADEVELNFAGAGAYEHHIPAAVWQIVGRGEFYSAYTPYQAEASQGTLQLIYEYQTMLTRLTATDVSNASMYDGATALAEALLMAERSQRRGGARRVLVPESVHPAYRQTVRAILDLQQIEVVELPCPGGCLDAATLAAVEGDYTALVVPQPNFFGVLEEADALADAAHAAGALVVAVVNPMSLALLKPPGEWGGRGADIVCGDGQPLGVPLSSGGPYFGFLACKKELVRNMPGRIVGRTVDVDGRDGYALTLQAREQHIRRAKATSNICTNQGLLVTAATIYLSLLGPQGLAAVAQRSLANLAALRERLVAIPGVEPLFAGREHFHETAFRLPKPAAEVVERLAAQRVVAGVALGDFYAGRDDVLLVCTTETKRAEDLDRFATLLADALR
ncbi:aminomethyl-transferring glycine dehydrogenase subunit GcvPA [Coralloluteibacterium stylophorae]|uniref:Probable glycine dehydrogenase (decarboxylating) subunit 1 n=1 Tax=Coralloluteibacterium stylophorae TaxID=1776034 RepID=A0AAP2C9T4_9GAMM|nr:aminomethyl-transferring glycine dehydrogenase subunit GcvPA [Coralloluteibacterium stylophorae]MBS7456055.1 aminomethyl-transferring glycine dehydrogenase subunit GcvPA [Coralloluteibacterium stylophorae]